MVVSPGHHGAALALSRGRGIQHGAARHSGGLCIGQAGVFALPAAANQDLAATGFAAGVHFCCGPHLHGLCRGMEKAAQAVQPLCAGLAIHLGLVHGLQVNLAAFT